MDEMQVEEAQSRNSENSGEHSDENSDDDDESEEDVEEIVEEVEGIELNRNHENRKSGATKVMEPSVPTIEFDERTSRRTRVFTEILAKNVALSDDEDQSNVTPQENETAQNIETDASTTDEVVEDDEPNIDRDAIKEKVRRQLKKRSHQNAPRRNEGKLQSKKDNLNAIKCGW